VTSAVHCRSHFRGGPFVGEVTSAVNHLQGKSLPRRTICQGSHSCGEPITGEVIVHRGSDSSLQKFLNFWKDKFWHIKKEKFSKKTIWANFSSHYLNKYHFEKLNFWRKKISLPRWTIRRGSEIFYFWRCITLQKRIFEKNYILTVSYDHVKNW